MDCCHSGTNTRAILPPDAPVKERYLPSPWGLAAVESGRSLPKKVTSELRRAPRAARKAKDIVNAELPEVLITGCRDTQTSADAFINGAYNGALTFALVEAIRQSKGRLTYRELHDRASGVLKKRKFDQVPQLEGRAADFDRRCFRCETVTRADRRRRRQGALSSCPDRISPSRFCAATGSACFGFHARRRSRSS